jgi:hypothetical protein
VIEIKYSNEMYINMIKDLEENILNNKQIAQKYNCSISLVENFNSCKYHNNLHNYKKNIHREANNMISNCINEYTIIKNGICSINIINTKGEKAICLFDYEDLKILQQHSWTIRLDKQSHYRVQSEGKSLHQFLLEYDSSKYCVDHIDQNPLNNCRSNLRITTSSINSTNARPRPESKTKIRGVYFRPARKGISKDSWICEWSVNGKRHTKSFSCEKYGEKKAFELAKKLREEKMKEMKI